MTEMKSKKKPTYIEKLVNIFRVGTLSSGSRVSTFEEKKIIKINKL